LCRKINSLKLIYKLKYKNKQRSLALKKKKKND